MVLTGLLKKPSSFELLCSSVEIVGAKSLIYPPIVELALFGCYPEQAVSAVQRGTRSISFEDRQLLPQGGVFQRDLFVAGKDEKDEAQYSENRLEHDAVLCLHRCRKSIASFAFTNFGEGKGPVGVGSMVNITPRAFSRSNSAWMLSTSNAVMGIPCLNIDS